MYLPCYLIFLANSAAAGVLLIQSSPCTVPGKPSLHSLAHSTPRPPTQTGIMSCMPCHAMPCHVTSRHVTSRYGMSCHAMPCRAMPCRAMPCHAVPCQARPRHATPRHATPPLPTRPGQARPIGRRSRTNWDPYGISRLQGMGAICGPRRAPWGSFWTPFGYPWAAPDRTKRYILE